MYSFKEMKRILLKNLNQYGSKIYGKADGNH